MGEPPETGFLEHRGCRLAYSIRGDGPAVLLIQGVGLHGDGWNPQIEELSDRYRCLSFDNRGMADSQPVGATLTVDQMAEDALALMDAAGMNAAHVVGHSLGGLIALNIALRAREQVRSLALLCTFATGRAAAPLSWKMISAGMRMQFGTRTVRRRAFLELIMPVIGKNTTERDASTARLASIFGHDLADQPPIVNSQLKAMRAYDAAPRLGELAGLSTLVVSAVHDPIAPPKLGRAIAAGLPGARYVEIADASHGVPVQFPDRINQLLFEHFAGLK